MTKRLTITTALGFLVFLQFTSSASAQSAEGKGDENVGVHHKHLAVLEPVIGEAKGSSRFGLLKGEATRNYKWAANGNAIAFTETYEFDPEDAKARNLPTNPMVLTGMICWDPAVGKIKETHVDSHGSSAVTYFEPDGDKLIGERKLTYANGRTDPYKFVWEIKEDGSFTFAVTNLVGNSTGNIKFGPTNK